MGIQDRNLEFGGNKKQYIVTPFYNLQDLFICIIYLNPHNSGNIYLPTGEGIGPKKVSDQLSR